MRPMGIDFIRARSLPRVGWLILLAGAVLSGIAAGQWLTWHRQQLADQLAQAKRLQTVAEQERQRLAALPPSVPPYTDDKRWQRAARELTLPWMDTLRAIERATRPPVYLLGFKSDPVSGRLQLEAEAPDLDAALGYVKALQGDSQLGGAQLQTHDAAPDAQGRPQLRFALQTQWVQVGSSTAALNNTPSASGPSPLSGLSKP